MSNLEPVRLSGSDYAAAFVQAHTLIWRRLGWFIAAAVLILLSFASTAASEIMVILMPAAACVLFHAVLVLARSADEARPVSLQEIGVAFYRALDTLAVTSVACLLMATIGVTLVVVSQGRPLLPALLDSPLPDRPALVQTLRDVDIRAVWAALLIHMVTHYFATPIRFLLRQFLDKSAADHLWMRAESVNGRTWNYVSTLYSVLVIMITASGLYTTQAWLTTTYYFLVAPTWLYVVFRMMFPQKKELSPEQAPDTTPVRAAGISPRPSTASAGIGALR